MNREIERDAKGALFNPVARTLSVWSASRIGRFGRRAHVSESRDRARWQRRAELPGRQNSGRGRSTRPAKTLAVLDKSSQPDSVQRTKPARPRIFSKGLRIGRASNDDRGRVMTETTKAVESGTKGADKGGASAAGDQLAELERRAAANATKIREKGEELKELAARQRTIETKIQEVKERQFRDFLKTSGFDEFGPDVWRSAEAEIKSLLARAAEKK